MVCKMCIRDRSVELLRGYFQAPGLTTDLIVGFPGETEEEFAQTLTFVERCAFTAMHIFPYSRRTGTPAADLPGQAPRDVYKRQLPYTSERMEAPATRSRSRSDTRK